MDIQNGNSDLTPPSESSTKRQLSSEALLILQEEAEFTDQIRQDAAKQTESAPSRSPNEPSIRQNAGPVHKIKGSQSNRGLVVFFAISLSLALMAAIYANGDAFSESFPQLTQPIDTYSAFIDRIKFRLVGW